MAEIPGDLEKDAPSALDNAFMLAFWFFDAALNRNEYLQPQKLHRLLFLAQAYFAVAYNGRVLCPMIFVADEMGPIEPNVYAALSQGRPAMDLTGEMSSQVELFLDSFWRRFGHHSVEHLSSLCKDTNAYLQAYNDNGPRSVISQDAMRQDFNNPALNPDVQWVKRPRVLRSQSGKPVAVSEWLPNVRQIGAKSDSEQAANGQTTNEDAAFPNDGEDNPH